MRTAEPMQYDVNVADWTGLYGFGFTLGGDVAMNDDVQVMQIDSPSGFTGASTSKGILSAWGGRDSNTTDASKSYGMTSIAATSSGYVVAYASGKFATTAIAFDTIHVVNVDPTGVPSNDQATPLDGATLAGNLAATADDTGRSVVYFLDGTAPSLSLKSLTTCSN